MIRDSQFIQGWHSYEKLFKSTIAVELKVLKTTKLEKFEVTHGMPLIPV